VSAPFAYEFHFDPDRPSPYILEMIDDGDGEYEAVMAFHDSTTTSVMPLDKAIAMLEEHYPWTISRVEVCPTCGR
jgi:hypothetical protein